MRCAIACEEVVRMLSEVSCGMLCEGMIKQSDWWQSRLSGTEPRTNGCLHLYSTIPFFYFFKLCYSVYFADFMQNFFDCGSSTRGVVRCLDPRFRHAISSHVVIA